MLLWFIYTFINAQNVMKTVPVTRYDHAPRTCINSQYQSSNQNVGLSVVWNTTRPTLNLDNFNEITGIECSSELVTLTFNSSVIAKAAFKKWSVVDNLAVLIGHEHQCKGIGNVTILAVSKISEHNGCELVLDTEELDYHDLIKDFELNLTDTPADVPNNESEEVEEIGSGLQKRGVSNHSTTLHMNLNYDPITKKVERPSYGLRDYVRCVNCFMTGKALINLNIKVRHGIVQEYKLSVDGDITANMDLKFSLPAKTKTTLKRIPLVDIPLTPMAIPGLFDLGPSIFLETGIALDLYDDFDLAFGFHYAKKFKYLVQGKLFHDAQSSYTEDRLMIPHETKQKHRLAFGISAHLIPGIRLGLSIATKPIFAIGLEFDSSVGMKVGEGVNHNCESKFAVAMVERNTLKTRINIASVPNPFSNRGDLSIPFYTTGDKTLLCAFCNKCFQ